MSPKIKYHQQYLTIFKNLNKKSEEKALTFLKSKKKIWKKWKILNILKVKKYVFFFKKFKYKKH